MSTQLQYRLIFMPLSNEFVLGYSHSFCMKPGNPKVIGNIIFRKWGKASISIEYICTVPFQCWNKPKLRLIPRDYQQNICKQKRRFPKMRHYCGTMEDRTSSAEISRQGEFRVDSNTNTFVYFACVNMAAIGITVHGVKTRKPWDVAWN